MKKKALDFFSTQKFCKVQSEKESNKILHSEEDTVQNNLAFSLQ